MMTDDHGWLSSRRKAVVALTAASLLGLLAVAADAFSHNGAAQSAAAAEPIVLGSPDYNAPYGKGWGTARPRTIFNGGAPSGLVKNIRWRSWGGKSARGVGRIAMYRPGGGYHRKLGRIELRAYSRGTCPGTGRKRAYTKLKARAQERPGGPLGRWFMWSGDSTICGTSG